MVTYSSSQALVGLYQETIAMQGLQLNLAHISKRDFLDSIDYFCTRQLRSIHASPITVLTKCNVRSPSTNKGITFRYPNASSHITQVQNRPRYFDKKSITPTSFHGSHHKTEGDSMKDKWKAESFIHGRRTNTYFISFSSTKPSLQRFCSSELSILLNTGNCLTHGQTANPQTNPAS